MMTITVKQAWRNIVTNRLRSLLALLGVCVGTASIVTLISIGLLTINEAVRQFEAMGTDLFSMQLQFFETSRPGLQTHKVERLSPQQIFSWMNVLPVKQVAVYADVYDNLFVRGQRMEQRVLGVSGDFYSLLHITMQSGRFISTADHWQPYAVVGADVARQLQQTFAQPILGMVLRVGAISYQVVGVLAPWKGNSFIDADLNRSVLIPLDSALTIGKWIQLNNAIFQLRADADVNQVKSQLKSMIEKTLMDRTVSFKSPKEIIENMQKQQTLLQLFLMIIAGITLLVGAIGIMNAMLVSVVERKKEIGVRMAVGATARDVLYLFLFESILLSVCGGVLGVILGIAATAVGAWLWQWQFFIFVSPCVFGALAAMVTGLIAGVYPAWQAAQVDPIEALRSL